MNVGWESPGMQVRQSRSWPCLALTSSVGFGLYWSFSGSLFPRPLIGVSELDDLCSPQSFHPTNSKQWHLPGELELSGNLESPHSKWHRINYGIPAISFLPSSLPLPACTNGISTALCLEHVSLRLTGIFPSVSKGVEFGRSNSLL